MGHEPRVSASARESFGIVLVLVACTPAGHALDRDIALSQLDHRAWSTREGAPAEVGGFAQTEDGLLWLASPTDRSASTAFNSSRSDHPRDRRVSRGVCQQYSRLPGVRGSGSVIASVESVGGTEVTYNISAVRPDFLSEQC